MLKLNYTIFFDFNKYNFFFIMSFEKIIKKDNSKNVPLFDNNIDVIFNQLQNKFLQFMKLHDEIIEYDRKLNSMNRKEYDIIKSKM
jgi:hypothetical protein